MAPVSSDIHTHSFLSIPGWGIFGIVAAGIIAFCLVGYLISMSCNKKQANGNDPSTTAGSDTDSPASTARTSTAWPFAQPPPPAPVPVRSVTSTGIIASADFKRLWKDVNAPSAAAVVPSTWAVSVGGAVPALASSPFLVQEALCEKTSEADSTTAQPPTPAFLISDTEDQDGFVSSETVAEVDIPDAAEIVANIHLSISTNSLDARASASSTGSGFTTENVRDISINACPSTYSAYSWSSTCTLESAPYTRVSRGNVQSEIDLSDSPSSTPPPPSASPSSISSSFSSTVDRSGSSTFRLSAIFLSPLPSDSEGEETDEETDIGQCSNTSHTCVEASKDQKSLSYIMPGSFIEKETSTPTTLSTSPPPPAFNVIAVHHPDVKLLQGLSDAASTTTPLVPFLLSLPPQAWSSAIARFHASRQRSCDTSSTQQDAQCTPPSDVTEDDEEILQYVPRTPSPTSSSVSSEDSSDETDTPQTPPPRPSTPLGKISIHKPSTLYNISPTLSPTRTFRVGLASSSPPASPPKSPSSPSPSPRRKASSAYQRPQIYTIYEEV